MLKRLYFLGSGEHCSVWGAELVQEAAILLRLPAARGEVGRGRRGVRRRGRACERARRPRVLGRRCRCGRGLAGADVVLME